MAEAKTKTPDTSTIIDLGLEMLEQELERGAGGGGGDEIREPQKPYIKIIEEPAKKTRFRYKADGHPGSLPGENSTIGKKSHVKVQVVGYQGPARLMVTLVEDDRPHRLHPHKLVDCNRGEVRCCKNGVFIADVSASSDMVCAIQNLGIRRVLKKEKDVRASLEERRVLRVDPFKQVNNSLIICLLCISSFEMACYFFIRSLNHIIILKGISSYMSVHF